MKTLTERSVKIIKTMALYFSFFSFGMSFAIPGPTLIDLQQLVNTETNKIAFIYLSRSASCLTGSIVGGIVFDMVKKKQLLFTIGNTVLTISTLCTPWCRSLTSLVGTWAVSGFSMGALDTGSNVLCLNLWGKESAPYFQALHFIFGLGGFISPLIAEPFLSKPCSRDIDSGEFNDTSAWYGNVSTELDNFTLNSNEILPPCDDKSFPTVVYAYIIVGIFSGFVAALFLIVTILFPEDDSKKKDGKTDDNPKASKDSVAYTASVVLLSVLLIGSYCGIEIGYAQMVATFAVKGDLKLSKSTASFITALFWGTFTFTRGVTVYLSYKFSVFTLVFGDIVIVILASGILLAFGNSHVIVLWVGTFLLAMGVASFFPSVVSWVENYIHLNNKMASLFVVAASLGEMIVPLAVSQYVESEPQILMFIIMGCSIIGSIVAFVLWFIMNRRGPKK